MTRFTDIKFCPSCYCTLDSVESFAGTILNLETEKPGNFKFKIGDEVYFKLYRKNCIVDRQLLVFDISGKFRRYDIAQSDGGGPVTFTDVDERWIERGYKVE